MRIPPLRIAWPGSRLGRPALAGGLLLALAAAAAAAAAGPAVAAPVSGASTVRQVQRASGGAATAGSPIKVTWSIEPATAAGLDRSRTFFNYGVVAPGSTVADHVEVANDSRESAAFSIYGTDATGTALSGALLLLSPQKKPTDIGSWVHFPGGASQLTTIIPGGKAVLLEFTVNVPAQATPGDHTGGMVAEVSIPGKNSAGMAVTENYRIAVPLELRVSGALRAGLQVQSISTGISEPLNPFGTGTATISYSVVNTGNVRLTGTQAVTISAPFGQHVIVKTPKLPTVLPGDSVRVTAQAPGLFPAGPMTAKVTVTPAWGTDSQPLSSTPPLATGSASLFALPWSLLGLILLLVALGVGIWFYLRWRGRLRRAELAAVATRASRETERRLLGGRAAANGHSANGDGHSANGDGPKPSAEPAVAEAAPAVAEAAPAAPGGAPDGGGPATEGTTE
jgi:hypothetical protein